MSKNIALKMAALALMLGIYSSAYSCTVTITNTIENPVLIVELEGKYAQMVMPGATEQVGSSQFHANFYLFEQINNKFVPRYTVEQASCNLAKHQDITVTDIIENSNDVAKYFTVTSPHAPSNEKPCCHHKN